MKKKLPKLIIILGPTASGKTKLAVALARKFNGEIVSADSRQVYIGMDIGTGKDLKEYGKGEKRIPYHLIDIILPKTEFNVFKFKKKATVAINNITARGKTPLVVGGTGLYISALVDNYQLPLGKPDKKIRQKLKKMKIADKLEALKKLDMMTYEKIDKNNLRRIDRALEVCFNGQKFSSGSKKKPIYNTLQIGLKFPKNVMNKKIDKRVDDRLLEGMIGEIKKLHAQKISWRRMESFGLEYRFISRYLRGKYKNQEMINLLKTAIHQFAKRQMTWFKRDTKIHWIENKSQAEKLIKKFLKK